MQSVLRMMSPCQAVAPFRTPVRERAEQVMALPAGALPGQVRRMPRSFHPCWSRDPCRCLPPPVPVFSLAALLASALPPYPARPQSAVRPRPEMPWAAKRLVFHPLGPEWAGTGARAREEAWHSVKGVNAKVPARVAPQKSSKYQRIRHPSGSVSGRKLPSCREKNADHASAGNFPQKALLNAAEQLMVR